MKEILCVPRIIPRESKPKSLPAEGVIFDGLLSDQGGNEGLMTLNDGSFVAMMSNGRQR